MLGRKLLKCHLSQKFKPNFCAVISFLYIIPAGMNAAVRAVVRVGIYTGAKVFFVHEVNSAFNFIWFLQINHCKHRFKSSRWYVQFRHDVCATNQNYHT